jgi:hypothetical protein
MDILKIIKIFAFLTFALVIHGIVTIYPDLIFLYFMSYTPMIYLLFNFNDRTFFHGTNILGLLISISLTIFIQSFFFGKLGTQNILLESSMLLSIIIYNYSLRYFIKRDLSTILYAIIIIIFSSLIEWYNINSYSGIYTHNLLYISNFIVDKNIQATIETFIIFSSSMIFFFIFFSKQKYVKVINTLIFLSILLIYNYSSKNFTNKSTESNINLNALIVQQKLGNNNTSINSSVISNIRVNTLLNLTKKLLDNSKEKVDLIIWTESVILFPINNMESPLSEVVISNIQKFLIQYKIPFLLLGTQYLNDENNSLSGASLISQTDFHLIKKKFKVPLLEHSNPMFGNIEKETSYSDKTISIKDKKILVMICYELIQEGLAKNRPSLIINLSNESIFLNKNFSNYIVAKAKRLAIKNNSYLIKVGTPGFSLAINNNGDIIKQIPFGSNDGFFIKLPLLDSSENTSLLWEYLNYLLIALLFITIYLSNKNIKGKNENN